MRSLRWFAAALRLAAAASCVAPRPPIRDRASSTSDSDSEARSTGSARSSAFRRDAQWHLKYSASFCGAAAEAPPVEAAWPVVYTPPSCYPYLQWAQRTCRESPGV